MEIATSAKLLATSSRETLVVIAPRAPSLLYFSDIGGCECDDEKWMAVGFIARLASCHISAESVCFLSSRAFHDYEFWIFVRNYREFLTG